MANFIQNWWRDWFTVQSVQMDPLEYSLVKPPIPGTVTAGGPEMVAAYNALTGDGPRATPMGTGRFVECDLLHVTLTSDDDEFGRCKIEGCNSRVHDLPDNPDVLKSRIFVLSTQVLQLGVQSAQFIQLNNEQIKLVKFWESNLNPDFSGSLSIVDMAIMKIRQLLQENKELKDIIQTGRFKP